MPNSGYIECACCGDILVVSDDRMPGLCTDCLDAGCGVFCTDCRRYEFTLGACLYFKVSVGKSSAEEAPRNGCSGFRGLHAEACCLRPTEEEE